MKWHPSDPVVPYTSTICLLLLVFSYMHICITSKTTVYTCREIDYLGPWKVSFVEKSIISLSWRVHLSEVLL